MLEVLSFSVEQIWSWQVLVCVDGDGSDQDVSLYQTLIWCFGSIKLGQYLYCINSFSHYLITQCLCVCCPPPPEWFCYYYFSVLFSRQYSQTHLSLRMNQSVCTWRLLILSCNIIKKKCQKINITTSSIFVSWTQMWWFTGSAAFQINIKTTI